MPSSKKSLHSRLLSVVGSSGSGKSSLIRAGLLPRLTELPATGGMGWSRAEMRPGEAPIRQLAEALADLDRPGDVVSSDPAVEARADRIELVLRDSSFGIRETFPLLRGLGDKTLFILVDQFEEVFRFADLRAQEILRPYTRCGIARRSDLLRTALIDGRRR